MDLFSFFFFLLLIIQLLEYSIPKKKRKEKGDKYVAMVIYSSVIREVNAMRTYNSQHRKESTRGEPEVHGNSGIGSRRGN